MHKTVAMLICAALVSYGIDPAKVSEREMRGYRRAYRHSQNRSRGPQAKPKKRRNMVTVGRRVRRKHRRAA